MDQFLQCTEKSSVYNSKKHKTTEKNTYCRVNTGLGNDFPVSLRSLRNKSRSYWDPFK